MQRCSSMYFDVRNNFWTSQLSEVLFIGLKYSKQSRHSNEHLPIEQFYQADGISKRLICLNLG